MTANLTVDDVAFQLSEGTDESTLDVAAALDYIVSKHGFDGENLSESEANTITAEYLASRRVEAVDHEGDPS